MRIGFLYAGQGSQHPGMGADLYEAYPAFRAVLDEAREEVDFDLLETSFRDPEGVLNETRYTQPAMAAFAAGVTAVLRERGVRPAAAAGLSLGEYSALQGAGAFDARTAVRLTAFRGQAMERASRGVESAMMAVLGLDRAGVEAACLEASRLGAVAVANYNCPGQVVIGGEKAAVDAAVTLVRERGARRCMPLRVSGPFHTPLMAPAASELEAFLRQVPLGEPEVPVLFNCLGGPRTGDEPIRDLLVRQVQSGVYMEDCIRAMAGLADAVVEIGPGKVLSGFVRKTVPALPVYAVETVSDIEALPSWLAGLEKEGER